MRKLLLALALTFLALPAQAGEIRPAHAHSIALKDVTGVAYYTVEGSDYRLVAVLASREGAAPIRFSASLRAGDHVTVSVPGAAGEPASAVEIVRDGDAVIVDPAVIALN